MDLSAEELKHSLYELTYDFDLMVKANVDTHYLKNIFLPILESVLAEPVKDPFQMHMIIFTLQWFKISGTPSGKKVASILLNIVQHSEEKRFLEKELAEVLYTASEEKVQSYVDNGTDGELLNSLIPDLRASAAKPDKAYIYILNTLIKLSKNPDVIEKAKMHLETYTRLCADNASPCSDIQPSTPTKAVSEPEQKTTLRIRRRPNNPASNRKKIQPKKAHPVTENRADIEAEKARMEAEKLARENKIKAEKEEKLAREKIRKTAELQAKEAERLLEESKKMAEAEKEKEAKIRKAIEDKKAREEAKAKKLERSQKLKKAREKTKDKRPEVLAIPTEPEEQHDSEDEFKPEISLSASHTYGLNEESKSAEPLTLRSWAIPLKNTSLVPHAITQFSLELKRLINNSHDIYLIGSSAANFYLQDKYPDRKVEFHDFDIKLFNCDLSEVNELLKSSKEKLGIKEYQLLDNTDHPIIRLTLKNGEKIEIGSCKKNDDETCDEALARTLNQNNFTTISSHFFNLTNGRFEVQGSEKSIDYLLNERIGILNPEKIEESFRDDPRRFLRVSLQSEYYKGFRLDKELEEFLNSEKPALFFKQLKYDELKQRRLATFLEETLFSRFSVVDGIDLLNRHYNMFEAMTGLAYKDCADYLHILHHYNNSHPYTKRLAFYVFLLTCFCKANAHHGYSNTIDQIKAWHFYPMMEKIIPDHLKFLENAKTNELIAEKMAGSLFPEILVSVPVDFKPDKRPAKNINTAPTQPVPIPPVSKPKQSTTSRSHKVKSRPLHEWLTSLPVPASSNKTEKASHVIAPKEQRARHRKCF